MNEIFRNAACRNGICGFRLHRQRGRPLRHHERILPAFLRQGRYGQVAGLGNRSHGRRLRGNEGKMLDRRAVLGWSHPRLTDQEVRCHLVVHVEHGRAPEGDRFHRQILQDAEQADRRQG